MKASIVSALLFAGAMAMPARMDKRAIFTEEVTMTEWTTTTIYVDALHTAGAFAERQSLSSNSSSTSSSSPTSTMVSVSATISLSSVVVPTTIPTVVALPTTTSIPEVKVPATVTTPAVVATPSPIATAPASGSGPSGSGDLTFYELGQVSCGETYSDSDFVVALAIPVMNNPPNPNNNPLCGKSITITYGSITQTAKVVDTCAGCAPGDVDLSPTLFQALVPGGLGAGRVTGAKWSVA